MTSRTKNVSCSSLSDVLHALRAVANKTADVSFDWREALETICLQGPGDDLLFFVRPDQPYMERVFVRRRTSVFSIPVEPVDFFLSACLNVVVQSVYTLTIRVCSRKALQTCTLFKVVKAVHALPYAWKVDLSTHKSQTRQESWPDVSFAVDDFESTRAQIIEHDDLVYVAALRAVGGPAFQPAGAAQNLLSGLVSSEQLRAAFAQVAQQPGKAERVVMSGPSGYGRFECAVEEADGCLQCSMMNVSLPWDVLTRLLLLNQQG